VRRDAAAFVDRVHQPEAAVCDGACCPVTSADRPLRSGRPPAFIVGVTDHKPTCNARLIGAEARPGQHRRRRLDRLALACLPVGRRRIIALMPSASADSIAFGLLGPLEALRGGEPVRLGGERQRVLLAVMLLRANTLVGTEQLADLLFGEQPAAGRGAAVRVAMSRLRRVLGSTAERAQIVETRRAVTGSAQTHLTAVPDRAQRTTSLRAVQQASINVPTLSWLSFYQGSVWVNSGDGFNTRIDSQTNKSTGGSERSPLGGAGNYCQGLGARRGALWSCSGASVTRIDPERMKVVARIRVGKAFDQGRLVFMDGRIWVITGLTGNELVGIDTATNQPGAPIKLPFGCDDLAWGETALWVLCPRANRVVKVNVADRSIDGTLVLAQAYDGFATPTDAITEFSASLDSDSGPRSIAPGADGSMWCSARNACDRRTPSRSPPTCHPAACLRTTRARASCRSRCASRATRGLAARKAKVVSARFGYRPADQIATVA
jgi:hypothetical protein